MLTRLTKTVRFPIIQANKTLWQNLGGRKHDTFIFDRCGRLTFYLPFPKSYVQYKFLEATILLTYFETPCGECSNFTTEHFKSTTQHLPRKETISKQKNKPEDLMRNRVNKLTTSRFSTTARPRGAVTQQQTTKTNYKETKQNVSNETILSDCLCLPSDTGQSCVCKGLNHSAMVCPCFCEYATSDVKRVCNCTKAAYSLGQKCVCQHDVDMIKRRCTCPSLIS